MALGMPAWAGSSSTREGENDAGQTRAAQCAFSVSICGLGSATQFVILRAAKITLCKINS